MIAALYSGCAGNPDNIDTVAPEVILQSPERGAKDIAVNASITAAFDKRVVGINGSATAFTIQKVGSYGSLPANVSYNDTTFTATLDPVNNLEADSVYVVTLSSDVKSRTGIELDPVSWTFITGVAEDVTSPVISTVTPGVDARYIPSDEKIEVTFSENLQDTSVNAASFILKKGPDIIPSTIIYNGVKAVLTPAAQLEDWTDYSVILTDEIRDIAGNGLSETIWTFKTDDTTPPWPMTVNPEMDAVVPVNTVVTIQFNESVKSYTIHNTSTSFVLKKESTGAQIPASVVYNDTTRTATLTPLSSLEQSTVYRIYLTDAIKDNAHNALSPISWPFTTSGVADVIKPQIQSKNPGSGNTGIALDSAIVVQFNEKVTGVNSSSFGLKNSSGESILSVVTYNPSTQFATLTPAVSLSEGTEYTVILDSSIKDIAGNSLLQTEWNFVTLDITKPVIVSKTPGAVGGVGVNSTVSIVFSEALQGATLTSASLKVDDNGTPVSGQVSYDSFSKTAAFTPDADLKYSTTYKITLSNSTDRIKDLFNNFLDTTEWNFTTGVEPDLISPLISSHYPASGGTMISRNADFTITFSEAVTGVSASNIILYSGVTPVASQIYYDAMSRTATIRPNVALQYNTVYTVKVTGGGSTTIKDSADNYLADNAQWDFTTVPDTTPPSVISKTPEPGVPDIPGNAITVEAVFSENVTGVNPVTMKLIRVIDSVEVPCAVNYYPDFNTNTFRAVMTPTAPVTVTGEYIVQMTDVIQDSAGNKLTVPLGWTFLIIPVDETAPSILTRTPDTGNTWLNNKVQVVFSEDVKGLTASSFYVTGPSGIIPAVVSYSSGLLTATLESEENLAYNTVYTAHLTAAITDRARIPLTAGEITWSFTTDVDTTAPWVTVKSPVNGTNGFPVNAAITAKFSESITGYNGSTVYLTPAASAAVNYDEGSKTLTLIPSANLAGNTTYTVTLTGGITDLATPSANPLGLTTWQFTTQNVPDTTAPVISSITPFNGESGILQSDNIYIVFSENVTNASGKITLKRQGAETVAANISYNQSTFTAAIDPVDELLQSTVYQVIVTGGSTGVKDPSGNYLAATSTTTFTTAADTTNPVVLSKYPESDTTGNPLKPVISISFNEPVTGVNSTSFNLKQGGTAVTPVYVIYDPATNTATLTPNTNLSNNTVYTVTLTSSIADRAGNTLAGINWNFTTDSLPVVSSTLPAEGATGVAVDTSSIQITFNRAMNPDKIWVELTDGTNFSPATPGKITWNGSYTVATIPVYGQFKESTEHKIKLYGWGGTFEDPEGNTLSKTAYVIDGCIHFTTGTDITDPTKVYTIPSNGRMNVGRDIAKIVVGFSEQMDSTKGAITLNPGSIVLTNRSFIDGNRTVVFDVPGISPKLSASSTYTATLSGFTDIANRSLSGTTFSFTTSSSSGETTIITEGFENFDGTNFSSFKNLSADDYNWVQACSTYIAGVPMITFPAITPAEGSYVAKAVDNMISYPGDFAEIELRNTIDLSSFGSCYLSFKMAHERLYNKYDRVGVYVSISGGSYVPVLAGLLPQYFFRYDYSYTDNNPLWKTHYVDLSDYAGSASVKVKLRAYSAGDAGNNIYIDDLRITGN